MPTIRPEDTAALLRVADVAARLGVSRRTVYKLTDAGLLECVYVGISNRSIRITERQLADYLNRRRSSR